MAIKSNLLFESKIQPTRQRLEVWRKSRPFREPIPERLWGCIVALARVHGVSAVSQALRLDYYTLKRRLLGSEPLRKARRPAAAQFVELPRLPAPAPSSSCTVELADGSGATGTIRWPQPNPAALLGLAEVFWRRRR